MSKKISFRFVRNKYVIIGIVILVVILFYSIAHKGKSVAFESAPATMGDVIEKVSVTGTISPLKKVDLAFKKSGVITRVPVSVGDHVKMGDLIASIDDASDFAAYSSAQATLDDMSRSLSKEELAVQNTSLDNARQNAVNAARSGYAKAESSFVNYMDSFFENPKSVNPTIIFSTDSTSQKNNINLERLLVTEALNKWSSKMDTVEMDRVGALLTDVESYLSTMKKFAGDLSSIIDGLSSANTGQSASVIDSYKVSMNLGLSTLNSAVDTVSASKTALSLAQTNYDLKVAGNSSASIAAQSAKVMQALINVNDARIVAPIDGVITKADKSVGEFAVSGQSSFAIQNDSGYKIEAYVPEADIAKVGIKNKADVTLDSYGQYVIFPATVTSVDPAETVMEGVPTYKVTLQFDNPDTRIRSGMTANTEIITHEVDNVLTVPTRAIVDDAGKKTVRIVDDKGSTFSEIPVVIGLKGSSGTTEIVSGLKLGDKVVTYVK